MITFIDEIEKVIVPHGVAADRLNKDLLKLVIDVYKRGLSLGSSLAKEYYEVPERVLVEAEDFLKMAFEQVDKTKSALEN